MTQRAEAQKEQQEGHHFQALVLTIFAVALIAGYAIFLGLYATHLPHTVGSGKDVYGAYYDNVTIKWDHLVIVIDGDFEMGDYTWEITRNPGNETVQDGMQGKDDGDTITAPSLDPGTYGVFVDPTGVNSAHKYDVTVWEYYITPGVVKGIALAALFFLAVLALCLWYSLLSKDTEKWREEYRLSNIAVALAMVLSVAVAVVPFL